MVQAQATLNESACFPDPTLSAFILLESYYLVACASTIRFTY